MVNLDVYDGADATSDKIYTWWLYEKLDSAAPRIFIDWSTFVGQSSTKYLQYQINTGFPSNGHGLAARQAVPANGLDSGNCWPTDIYPAYRKPVYQRKDC
ncbi:hypothetical protein OSTOST_23546 [Ostertagia ostertagi]